MTYMDPNDFYEDDEPVEKIVAAFESGDKVLTARPTAGFNKTLDIPGLNTGSDLRSSMIQLGLAGSNR